MFKQLATKIATRRPSMSEVFFAKTLLCWIWEVVFTQRSALVELYPTLMPPKHMANINWTSSAPAVYLLNENDKPTFPWSSRLPLLVFGTVLAAYAGRYSTKETSDIQKNNVPVTEAACSIQTTSSQALKLDMVGMPDENGRQRGSLNEHSLVLSPITTTTPYSAADSIILASRISLEEVPRKTERAASPIVGNLALSKIILTVDIPPSSPGQWDDDAINRLSELLERW